ncbi:hypothetical protein [Halobacteriovorax sp. HLS]|uniref:hypothetical protein n=1 Tax=Halobacteriovorax sp. HLS TaxID=2234000 RepID=UPI000FD97F15|nr:hypothetical protein [Halobacteriovorax sp. HLS]
MKHLLVLLLLIQIFPANAKSANIWPSIPFIRGMDECAYHNAFSRTRLEFIGEMSSIASELMESGAKGSEALQMLVTFDALYDKQKAIALQHRYIDVSLEATFKGFLDSYYRKLGVANRNIQFKHINSIQRIIQDASNGQRSGYLPENTFDYLDYVAYGTYSMGRNCRGTIAVTLTLVDKDGVSQTFQAEDYPGVVMSHIASRVFEEFQRTKFPSTLNLGNRRIRLVGSPTGTVSTSHHPRNAQMACESMGARLPNSNELELIDSYGDWNGGVSINQAVWAINEWGSAKVYHPGLRNPSPVRDVHSVNTRSFKYYCVK